MISITEPIRKEARDAIAHRQQLLQKSLVKKTISKTSPNKIHVFETQGMFGMFTSHQSTPQSLLYPSVCNPRSGAKDLGASASYPRQFGVRVAELHGAWADSWWHFAKGR